MKEGLNALSSQLDAVLKLKDDGTADIDSETIAALYPAGVTREQGEQFLEFMGDLPAAGELALARRSQEFFRGNEEAENTSATLNMSDDFSITVNANRNGNHIETSSAVTGNTPGIVEAREYIQETYTLDSLDDDDDEEVA